MLVSATERRLSSVPRGAEAVAEVIVRENETFEAALRRFAKRVQQNGVLAEARRRKYY